jgi:hypothetical protein
MAIVLQRSHQRSNSLKVQISFVKGWARDRSLSERFHASYMPVTESGCWIWIAKVNGQKGGDRRGVINDGSGRKYALAHRVSWELHTGPIPARMKVCHRCDVGLCVNPHHLFLGTQKQNLHDMVDKGRRHNQRLDWEKVRHIRESTESVSALAAKYGVGKGSIYNVRSGISWSRQ